jgi:hypothetical protein
VVPELIQVLDFDSIPAATDSAAFAGFAAVP